MASQALLTHRRKSMSAYRATTKGRCEVSKYLMEDPAFVKWEKYHCLPSIEVHHIYGRGGVENEHFSNYILVSNAAHDWGHDSCPKEFEVACLYAKMRKRHGIESKFKPDEKSDETFGKAKIQFDPFALLSVCKRASFTGRVESLRDDVRPEMYARMCDSILRYMKDVGYGQC